MKRDLPSFNSVTIATTCTQWLLMPFVTSVYSQSSIRVALAMSLFFETLHETLHS